MSIYIFVYFFNFESIFKYKLTLAYIKKVKVFDSKIENIAQTLCLLADTYQRVITSSQDAQQHVMNVINNYYEV